MRLSLHVDGTGAGAGTVRVGVEKNGKIGKKAIGYTISRNDVGSWIYETLLENKGGRSSDYINKFASITS